MLKFSEWIIEEARGFRPRQSVGGAFGKKNTGYSHSREDQRTTKDYGARIAFGKAQEEKIFAAAARNCGLNVTPATPYEDKILKIDGWWTPSEGAQKEPFSMKYRDTGPDILFEVIKPYITEPILDPRNLLGRDVKPPGKPANTYDPHSPDGAKYIFFLSKEGNKLSVIPADACYQIIGNMLNEVNANGWNQDNGVRKSHMTGKGTLRLQIDPASSKVKVMAYIPMKVITPVFQCNVNVSIA